MLSPVFCLFNLGLIVGFSSPENCQMPELCGSPTTSVAEDTNFLPDKYVVKMLSFKY